ADPSRSRPAHGAAAVGRSRTAGSCRKTRARLGRITWMSVPPAIDLQGLLAEDRWIRRLARRLAGDAHAAEDLVQETWAAALDVRQDAPRPHALRPWLRGILRNLWID